jgi:alcohol dehydrogenase
MRTFRFDSLGGIDDLALHQEPIPEPQRGEVLVKVHAVSLNRRDILMVQGNYPGAVSAGLIPCSDAAGEIVAVGEGVTAFESGDRVINTFHPRWFGAQPPRSVADETYGNRRDGWLTEYKVVSQEALVSLPDDLSWEEGSTLPCAGVTAWNALFGRSPVLPGQTVLTLGSGSVSLFAIQLAKAAGAAVIGTTSREAKEEALQKLGVDCVVNYSRIEEWGKYIKDETTQGLGADIVVETGGSTTLANSLEAVGLEGEVVLIGQQEGDSEGFEFSQLKKNRATIRSIGVGHRAMLENLVRAIQVNRIEPVVDGLFAFEESREAFHRLESGVPFGKIVLRLDT